MDYYPKQPHTPEAHVIPVALGPDASLADVLRARARAAAPSRLALDILGGAAIAAAMLWAKPIGWVIWLSASLCFCTYGTWALAERHLAAEPQPTAGAEFRWHALRDAAALVGISAFLALLFSLLGTGLGRWIS
ncbi:MAG: hypothetical protein WD771_11365 [Gemmatimonadaceae bacterium]